VDKYRPKELAKLDLHPNVTHHLNKMVESSDFPHVLLYGPSGAGKKTRAHAIVRELYGAGVDKAKVTHKTFKVKTKTIEISIISSNYHIEMNPSDVGNNDRHVVQEVIQEIAGTQNVIVGQQRTFKVVVLNEVDRLSKAAQHALRRTMEKYMATCRLILVCESACRVIGALKSRCLPIRVAAPTHEEICNVLQHVAHKENIQLPDALASRIAVESKRNVRRAILMLEACKVEQYPFVEDQKVRPADWERFVDELAMNICQEQSPASLLNARNKMYELLTNCIPPEIVIKTLTLSLLRRLDDQLKHELVRWAAFYQHRLQQGSKAIFHLEAFVARFMAMYKRWIVESFG